VAFTQTARPATSSTTSWTQTHRPAFIITSTDMPPVLVASTGYQAGVFFNNEEISAYPDVHPEDFVTFGVLHA